MCVGSFPSNLSKYRYVTADTVSSKTIDNLVVSFHPYQLYENVFHTLQTVIRTETDNPFDYCSRFKSLQMAAFDDSAGAVVSLEFISHPNLLIVWFTDICFESENSTVFYFCLQRFRILLIRSDTFLGQVVSLLPHSHMISKSVQVLHINFIYIRVTQGH